jgi:hypothetical protein
MYVKCISFDVIYLNKIIKLQLFTEIVYLIIANCKNLIN